MSSGPRRAPAALARDQPGVREVVVRGFLDLGRTPGRTCALNAAPRCARSREETPASGPSGADPRSSPTPRPRRRSEWGRAASGGSACCAGPTSRRVGTGRVRIMRDTEASRSGPGRGTASASPRCSSPRNPNRRQRSPCPHLFEPRRILQLPHEAAVRTVKAVRPRTLTRNCATWRGPDASGDRRHAWPRAAGARSVAPTDALAARRARRRSSALGFLRDAALAVSGRRRHEQPTQARRPHDQVMVNA